MFFIDRLTRHDTRLFFTLILLFGCCSCSKTEPIVKAGVVMTVPYRIVVDGNRPQDKLQGVLDGIFENINTVFNEWNPESEISRVNALPANTSLEVSPELMSLLKRIDSLVKLSEGRFDPTVEPLCRLWKASLEAGRLPVDATLKETRAACGWHHIHLMETSVSKDNGFTSLSLSGIAKGLAVDFMVEALVKEGWTSVYVDWGGEIRTYGEHPDGRPWMIAVADPRGTEYEPIAKIPLTNMAIATSGNYLQQWTVDGVTYTHIVDPRTGIPLQVTERSIASTTVVAQTCALADALATTLMLFEDRAAAAAWGDAVANTFPGVTYWVVEGR